jgi:hypothetical protein
MKPILRILVASVIMGTEAASGSSAEFNIQLTVKEIVSGAITSITISSNAGRRIAMLKYEGTVRNMKYNTDRTICAIDLAPGTQINDVYVITAMQSGRIAIIKDFNDRLLHALGNKADELNTDYIYVDRIENRILDVSLGAKDEPTYSLKATITARGDIQIVPKSIAKD